MDKLEELMTIIKSSKNIVFFGGAGVSVASGIPDFRGANGLYTYTPEEIISHHFFLEHTKEFYDFYWKKMVYPNALPNKCHLALTYLEKKGILKSVVTQNIDNLHQEAGTKNVHELHGSVKRNYCTKCHKFYDLNDLKKEGIPYCSCKGIIKPDVVLYEEGLDDKVINDAIYDISHADTLIVAGTSLVVYPAASFIRYFRGKNLVIINLGQTNYDNFTTLSINGKVEEYLNVENFKKYGI
jgi:NAD-dependent deacetylase